MHISIYDTATYRHNLERWQKGIKKPESPAGEYLIHYDRVTPNMGIACGVRYLAYHTEKAGCSELKDLDHLVTSDGKPAKELQQ